MKLKRHHNFHLNENESIPANAICLICGTAEEDSESGYCINGHDDWLEPEDEYQRVQTAIQVFGKPYEEIMDAIKNNRSLEVVDDSYAKEVEQGQAAEDRQREKQRNQKPGSYFGKIH